MGYTTTFTNCRQSSAIDVVPESLDRGMCSSPLDVKGFDFIGCEPIRELPKRSTPAHIAECEITGFADIALFLCDFVGLHMENLACCNAIGLVARIVRSVEATISIKLPLFSGDPGQNPAFNTAEVGTDQHVAGGGPD